MSLLVLSLILFISCCFSQEDVIPKGRKVLVLVDNLLTKKTHSKFLHGLTALGFELSVRLATGDDSIQLTEFGEYQYDHLLLLCPSVTEFGGFVDTASILEFIDSGRNVLLTGAGETGRAIRELGKQNNLEFHGNGNAVVDHSSFHASDNDGAHTLVYADEKFQPSNVERIFGTKKTTKMLYRGIGLKTGFSQLVLPLIRGSPAAYSARPSQQLGPDDDVLAGGALSYVLAQQARNGARVVATGSIDMFSNELIELADDADVALERLVGMASWTFQERGLLRAINIKHEPLDGNPKGVGSDHYRIGQRVRYSVDLQEWSGATQSWVPFVTDDVQLEFIMLDPHVRQFLVHIKDGHYEFDFKLPDVYGVFTFRTLYERAGLSPLHTMTRVPVRPFRHDEYERFIVSAYPYYASSFSMLVGLFIFAFVFLYNKDTSSKSGASSSGAGQKPKSSAVNSEKRSAPSTSSGNASSKKGGGGSGGADKKKNN